VFDDIVTSPSDWSQKNNVCAMFVMLCTVTFLFTKLAALSDIKTSSAPIGVAFCAFQCISKSFSVVGTLTI
jgi:hypothetical protein